ncbi:hypothetical protein EON65_11315 [archaeon]|nr:MAG: hypothetical protein EON65_11315 [archaeon]
MSPYDNESIVIIAVLMALSGVYLYLLFGPDQRHHLPLNKHVVIQLDNAEKVQQMIAEVRGYGGGYGGGGGFDRRGIVDDYWKNRTYEWGQGKKEDDFFLEGYNAIEQQEFEEKPPDPLVPSDKYDCGDYWVAVRAEINYRYLWMHGSEDFQMGASATVDTPAHRKSFKLHSVSNCDEEGWVLLQEGDGKNYIQMLSPNKSIAMHNTDKYAYNIRLGTDNKEVALADPSYHFLLEHEGYMVNRDCLACVNIMTNNDYLATGHSTGWYTHYPAQREFSAIMQFSMVNESEIIDSRAKEAQEAVEIAKQDQEYIQKIGSFPLPPLTEKHVISFGLYGSKPKYTTGALKNLQLAKIYFPGWVCRFYVTSDVPATIVTQLKEGGGEVVSIPDGKGYTSGMFWRFLVADDPAVGRYIIRDSDSRLNARDR